MPRVHTHAMTTSPGVLGPATDDGLPSPPPVDAAAEVAALLERDGFAAAAARAAAGRPDGAGTTADLVRLLALGVAVPASSALQPYARAGLLREDQGWWVPVARLASLDGLLLAGDLPEGSRHAGYVAPVSHSSRVAAGLTVRAAVRTGLDLCTGSGVLALLLARHCTHVVATDVAERALAWAAFNAALNALSLELRQGSFADPVQGERFDAVVANPPYVVGLGEDLLYRGTALPGDGVSELVVRALPGLLAADGWAGTTLSWAGPGTQRPRQWLEGADVQAWLLTARTLGPDWHALAWSDPAAPPVARARHAHRWADGLRAAGVEAVSDGALVLRASTHAGWHESEARLPAAPGHPTYLPSVLAARQAGPQPGDRPLLAPGCRLEDTGERGRLVRWDGTLPALDLDEASVRLVRACDGRTDLAALVARAAAGAALPEGAVEPEVLTLLRTLYTEGALVPAALPEAPSASTLRDRDHAPVHVAPARGPRLAAALQAQGYDAPGVAALLGTSTELLVRTADLPVYPLRCPPTGLGALVRLLLLGLPVDAADLPDPALTADLLAGGLAEADGPRLLPRAQLVPHGSLLLASDLPAHADRPDAVPGVQRPTSTLAELTPRAPVDRALDLGTGCGVQALLLARHARTVVATDVSARALAFAASNAALAGVTLDLRQGAWFDPVREEQFDLVVANPPYVLSPEQRWVFRDGGLPRDGVSRLVATALPGHLRDGGVGVALLSWVLDDPDAAPPPLVWSAGQGCSAALLESGTSDAWETATRWNADAPDPEAYAAQVARWLDWLREQDVRQVGYGALVLRRDGGGRTRRLELPPLPPRAAGAQAVGLLDPAPVLAPGTRLRPAPGTVLEQQVAYGERERGTPSVHLRQTGGLRLDSAVSLQAAALLDGALPDRLPGVVSEELTVLIQLGLLGRHDAVM